MINSQFCFLANVIIASRLISTTKDDPVLKKHSAMVLLLQLAGLLVFELGFALAILAGFLVLIGLLLHFLEHKLDLTNEPRLFSMLLYMILLSVFFSPWVNLKFNPAIIEAFKSVKQYSLILSILHTADWRRLNIIVLGFLLVANEGNIFIRYLFSRLNMAPKKYPESDESIIIDRVEYNAGRVIGILERLLIYSFVLNDQFAAIGLVLAAKGLTRFKELDSREFAEYFLIGTLVSTLLALSIATLTQSLLP